MNDFSNKIKSPLNNTLKISTNYIQFNNNRFVPECYIKQKEDRMNKTMENV